MNKVLLKTERTEMKYPLPFITPRAVVTAIGDEETIRFMAAVPTLEYTEETAECFIRFLEDTKESDAELELGIFDNNTNKFIGMCTLENIDYNYNICELGYWLNKAYVGKGYMTECANAVIQFAKEELHMKSVDAFVIAEHNKSIHLLERLGFKQIRLLKNDTENKGRLVDRYCYRLVLCQEKQF